MNILFKLIAASLIATVFSFAIGFFSAVALGFVASLLKLNYKHDNYWILSTSFIITILGWIISFGVFMLFL